MAQRITNRSQARIDVLVDTAAGQRILCLMPDQQTTAHVVPRAVKPTSAFDRLMDGQEWLEILTDQAVVYHWGFQGDRFSGARLCSLHCFPFQPAGVGPFDPGYQAMAEPTADDTDDPTFVEPAATADDKDGEFDLSQKTKNPFLFFGHYVRTKNGADTYITVRLNLRRMTVSEAELNTVKPQWKDEIERIWNNGVTSSTGRTYRIEVDWTDRFPHANIGVWESSVPIFGTSMFQWKIGMGRRLATDTVDTFPIAAHEFGHHLGLSDGYHYQGEIPHLADEMVKHIPLYNKRTVNPHFFWTSVQYAFGLNPITAPRAEERLANFAKDQTFQTPNLMTGAILYGTTGQYQSSEPGLAGSHRAYRTPMTTIDQVLIDAIENQELQPLRLDQDDFVEKESVPGAYEGYFDV